MSEKDGTYNYTLGASKKEDVLMQEMESHIQSKRENSYDILRIVCTFGVISIHVSATWLMANTNISVLGKLYQKHLLSTCLWNVISRFAVPCFMMMSGALILPNERNANFTYFYKKQFRRIGIPGLIFSFLYMIYDISIAMVAILIKQNSLTTLLRPIRTIICGDNHLWYLYTMTGVYALTPILIRLKRDIGEANFAKMTWIFLTLASIGYETSTSLFMWDIGFSFRFLGYFMAGYEIRRMLHGRKNNGVGSLLILAGVGIECIVAYVRYRQELLGISETVSSFPVVDPLCPWIVLASICIFAGFSLLNIRRGCPRIASNTFMIYLVHAVVWDILAHIIKHIYGVRADNRIWIPVSIANVFLISLALAYGIGGLKRRKSSGNMVTGKEK